MSVYTTLHKGGDKCTRRRAYIRLYPNTSYEENYYLSKSDDIPSAIDGAFSSLLSADAVTYYNVQRMDSSSVSYPDLSFSDKDEMKNKFKSYLKTGYENGTGQNLKNRTGIHMLVHSEGCDLSTAGGEHADNCNSPSAFKRGVMAFTGAACSGFDGLQRNSAIQEPVHGFIRFSQIKGSALVGGSGSTYDEHRLGEVRNRKVTPMLTYHASESDRYREGTCDGDGTEMNGYDQRLTDCTIEAVKQVSNNQCGGQQSKPDIDSCDNNDDN